MAILGVAFLVVGASVLYIVGDYLIKQKVSEELRIVDEMSVQLAPLIKSGNANALYASAVEYGRKYGGRVMVLNRGGKVLIDSFSELAGVRLTHDEVVRVLGGQTDKSFGLLRLPGIRRTRPSTLFSFLRPAEASESWVGYFTASITIDSKMEGALFFSTRVQETMDELERLQDQIIGLFLAISLTVIALSLIISNIVMRPLNVLTQGVNKLSRGEFSHRVFVPGRNEFSSLAGTLNRMSARLENLDRTRNQFVSSASHELKTPLSTIKILVESLLHEDMPKDLQNEFLRDVNSEIDRLNLIINDLLTLVQMDSHDTKLTRTPFPMDIAVAEVIKRLKPLIDKNGVQLETDLQQGLIIEGDRLKIQQVIYNLIDNAIKYAPKGSISIGVFKSGVAAVLSVSDTGVGIPKEDIPHVFDRFYRVDKARSRSTGGTGLGLSIVKNIILMHGGIIEVESEADIGTTFTVTLPLKARRLEEGTIL